MNHRAVSSAASAASQNGPLPSFVAQGIESCLPLVQLLSWFPLMVLSSEETSSLRLLSALSVCSRAAISLALFRRVGDAFFVPVIGRIGPLSQGASVRLRIDHLLQGEEVFPSV